MTEIPYINWEAMSDKAIIQKFGEYVKYHRLEQNLTQSQLSKAAGISRSTLSLLERGETVSLTTYIQILRVIKKLPVLNAFLIEETISPLKLAQLAQEKRQRASYKTKKENKKSSW